MLRIKPMKFTELIKISNGRTVMLCFGKAANVIDCYAYILCSPDGAKALHRDYESQKIVHDLNAYGEVLYMEAGLEPDAKAREFLKNWLASNS